MILSGIGYTVSFELRDFYAPARNEAEFDLQLTSFVHALQDNGPIPIAVGVEDANKVTLVFHLGSEAQEVKHSLQKVQLLRQRDGDPWWVKAERGEAPRDDSPAGNLPELPKNLE
jgi:hypothetical protein